MSNTRVLPAAAVIEELQKLGFTIKEVSPDRLFIHCELQTESAIIFIEVLLHDGAADFSQYMFPQFKMWAEEGDLRRDLIFGQRFEQTEQLRLIVENNFPYQFWFSRSEELGARIRKDLGQNRYPAVRRPVYENPNSMP